MLKLSYRPYDKFCTERIIMSQSRIKKKNQHLKKKEVNFHKPASKVASTVLLAGALTSTSEILLSYQAPKAEAATTSSQQAYIQNIASYAKPVADANGLFPSVMIAQAILESNWGTSTLSQYPYYNLFGIQGSYNGNSVSMTTKEYINGQFVTKVMPFRKYPSLSASFADNARVLKTTNFGAGYFYAAAWRSNASSYLQATAALTGKYATDPNYGNSLNKLISQYNLTQYDGFNSLSNTSDSSAGINSNPVLQTTTTQTYSVKSGDTLWGIAQKNNVSISQIKTWNGLKSDTIYIGQKLKLSKTISSNITSSSNTTNKVTNPTPTSPSSNKGGTVTTNKTIKVIAGHTLSAIAYQNKTTVSQLKAWNNLKSDLILVGQTLIVGKTTSVSPTNASSNKTPSKTSSNATSVHKVVSGDTLWQLAKSNNVSIQQIKSWNHLSSDTILIGQYLRVK